jgi:glycosyltransferase involved in cell wall biosynthesis
MSADSSAGGRSDKAAPLTGVAVLQIIPSLDSGGAERATVEVAAALTAAGARALVATEHGRLIPELEGAGARLFRLPLRSKNPFTILANGIRLARLVRAENIRLLHVRSRAPAFSALIAARLTGATFLATYHGVYSENGTLKRWYNGIMTRGAAVIANSAYTAAHVAERYPAARGRLVTIARGVDLRDFDPAVVSEARVKALKEAWDVGARDRILLVPGRITSWKGQELVIEALRLLKEEGAAKEIVAVLVGDTQSEALRKTLTNRVVTLGLGHMVRLAGHCADMPAAYKAAHLVLQPSRAPDAFGRVAAEAEAMGAIVIASNIGAAPEVVRGGPEGTGLLVPPGNVPALAAAIKEALSLAPEARAEMSARAMAHVRANFALETMCAKTLVVYAQLLDRAA